MFLSFYKLVKIRLNFYVGKSQLSLFCVKNLFRAKTISVRLIICYITIESYG